ncbi:MAG: class I SAM-dependent methyltransferase [bacterium]|nr:class I SAM-dependent methyltransferase [bacterium]
MQQDPPWHKDDRFWTAWRKWSFNEDIVAAADAEVNQLLDLVKPEPGARVLDLCCGPGRHSLEFAKRGFAVTGVDRTAHYIEEAKAGACEANIDCEFLVGDMLEFVRPGAFDLVVNLFTAFGYFDDPAENLQVLKNVATNLTEGGTLVMELVGKEPLARKFQPRDWSEHDGVIQLQERRIEKDWSWIQNRWIYIDGPTRHEFQIGHWIYSARELHTMLRESGFAESHAYGSLDGTPYDLETIRLVMVARR